MPDAPTGCLRPVRCRWPGVEALALAILVRIDGVGHGDGDLFWVA